ncbi:right-handed parallel beta-helix repeat-containing protein [Paenibacillus endoradicis]|uniref:right-handed parallel beta-helix repeat-containing protein n=1 Tax=Paenibacillus endoradicis TaxID=2972487 RepID=UPI002158E6C5|nr:NosD domain-containing protein [Paenibacillus endoradicis]MCR8659577.1 right-handed parallel beta-helix repeat-containing protein [Paenibacillus endoradicis]
MTKALPSRLFYILLIVCFLSISNVPHSSATSTLKSNSNKVPQDLQQLIDEAEVGAIIKLAAGDYNGSIIIEKPITIIGGSNVKLVIEDGQEAIAIVSDTVMVSTVEINDKRRHPQTAVITATGRNLQLEKLKIKTRATGIAIDNATESTVANNEIIWSGKFTEKLSNRGNGIQLYNSENMSITSNEINGMYDGIYNENNLNLIIKNNMVQNSRYAYHLMYGSNIQLLENNSIANITGMMIMTSQNIVVQNNVLEKQAGNVNSQGILLFDAIDITIMNNTVAESRVGIYVEKSSEVEISENDIHHNFVALQLIGSSEQNIQDNNFIGNVTNIWSDSSSIPNVINNYWDTFQGVDIDGDEFSNLTYASSPFFMELVERKPGFQLFFGSNGIQFVEQLYQDNKEQWLQDRAPRLQSMNFMQSNRVDRSSWLMLLIWIPLLIGSIIIIYKSRRI